MRMKIKRSLRRERMIITRRTWTSTRTYLTARTRQKELEERVLWQVEANAWGKVLVNYRRKEAILREAYLVDEVEGRARQVDEVLSDSVDLIWREDQVVAETRKIGNYWLFEWAWQWSSDQEIWLLVKILVQSLCNGWL